MSFEEMYNKKLEEKEKKQDVPQTEDKIENENQYEDDAYDYYDVEESPDGKFYLTNKVDNYYYYDKSELVKGVFTDREFAELVADLLNKDHGKGYEEFR